MKPPEGACPLCRSTGSSGDPCQTEVCVGQGMHFIPLPWFEHATRQDVDRDSWIGRVVDEYLIAGVLGEGGFGRVYFSLQRPLLMPSALKMMHPPEGRRASQELFVAKFKTEALSLSRLQHPNIVRLLRYGQLDGRPYLVMEFVPGGRTLTTELAERVIDGRNLGFAEMRHLLTQLLNALGSAHEQAILHRDIKPENIMLQRVKGDPLFVKILDFGLAKFLADDHKTSTVLGTPLYMAPEQLTGESLGPWTDLFPLGVILYEFLSGRQPWSGRNAVELISQKLKPGDDPVARLADLDLHPAVLALLRKALAADPAERFRTADEFQSALNEVFGQLESSREPHSTAGKLSGLFDAGHLEELAREKARIDEAKRHLDAERAQLESLRVELQRSSSDRTLQQIAEREQILAVLQQEKQARQQLEARLEKLQSSQHVVPDHAQQPVVDPPAPVAASSRMPLYLAIGVAVLLLVAALIWGPRLAQRNEPVKPTPGMKPGETRAKTPAKPGQLRNPGKVPTPRKEPKKPLQTMAKPGKRCSELMGNEPAPNWEAPNRGTVKNPIEALKVCRAACQARDARSCFFFGELHLQGFGVPRNYGAALKLLTLSCRLGSMRGCNSLGVMHYFGQGTQRNRSVAFRYFKRACDGRDAVGCLDVGWAYEVGHGVDRNLVKARQFYQLGCSLKYGQGCVSIGLLELFGKGVPVSHSKAFRRFREACALKSPAGCIWVGVSYELGYSVPIDLKKAIQFYTWGCVRGDGNGCTRIGSLYVQGHGVPRNYGLARANFEKACLYGCMLGCYQLGRMYEDGIGVSRDLERARKLYKRACELDTTAACNRLLQLQSPDP